MDRRIKILQLQPDYHENSHNYSDLAEQIGAAFPPDRYEVTNAFVRGRPAAGHPISRVEHVVYFDLPDAALHGMRLGLLGKLFRFCRENQFDVVICNRFKQVSLLMLLNRLLKIPLCIGISHGLGEYETFWRRLRAKWSINASWRFVGVSPAVKSYLLGKHCGFNESNTIAINNAIDIARTESEHFQRQEARNNLGLPADARIVGAAGRLVRIKGHKYLLQAFAKICAKYPDVHLCIIGNGREDDALREERKRLGIEERVHFPGFIAGAKRYVRAFDLWAMPSLTEGLPLALLEGMIGHLPIIASDIPSMRFIIDGAGGIAVPSGDVDALAEALDTYLSLSDSELREHGEKVYAYLCTNHGIDEYRGKYLQLVEQALSEVRK